MNISANILFLSVLKWGFLSAGYALVLTYIVQGLVIYFTVRRFYPVPYNFGKMAKNFIVIALLFFIPMLLENQYLLVNLALVIIYFPLLDLVGVLSLKQIRRELFKH